jgi:hypothetical protein
MWHDDSSPFRGKDIELRQQLEPLPIDRSGGVFRLEPPLPKMATCHPDRIHLARGYCYRCYYGLVKTGVFRLNPQLRAEPPSFIPNEEIHENKK